MNLTNRNVSQLLAILIGNTVNEQEGNL
jgi:hypothetical protein